MLPVPEESSTEVEAMHRAVRTGPGACWNWPSHKLLINVQQIGGPGPSDPLRLAYLIGSMLSLFDVAKEQALLEAPTRSEALRLMHRVPQP